MVGDTTLDNDSRKRKNINMKYIFLLTILFAFCSFSYGQDAKALIEKADQAYFNKEYTQAVEYFKQALDVSKDIPFYNAACVAALAEQQDLAFKWLYAAFDKGFVNVRHLQNDKDLSSLHSNPKWNELTTAMQKKLDKIEENYDKPLMQILLSIFDDDQNIRQQYIAARNEHGANSKQADSLAVIMNINDSVNVVKIIDILDKYGWVSEEKVGKQASMTPWLVIQHADLTTQQKYLPSLQEAVKNGQQSPENLALLEDRILIREGKQQIYGTQLEWDGEINKNVLSPLSDPDNVDVRRANVGLPPLADYLKNWGIVWDVEEYKKTIKY